MRIAVWSGLFALAWVGPVAAQSPAPLTPAEQRRVMAYLGCIECRRVDVDSLRSLARRKPVATVDSLARVLVDGLDSLRVQSYRWYLAGLHAASTRWSLPRDSFVARYGAIFELEHRRRAAVALRGLGVARADSALRNALNQPLPPEVRRAVVYSLTSLGPAPP